MSINNLSPLAFEIVKYLCKFSNSDDVAIDKETFKITSQQEFSDALEELKNNGLITFNHATNTSLQVSINKSSNVCSDLGIDFYLEEEAE